LRHSAKGKEIFCGDSALFGLVKKMLTKLRRQVLPLYFRHRPPKVIRASSSRSRFVSQGLFDF
jgi:hypothetical protein